MVREDKSGACSQYLAFTIGGQEFGIDILKVREITHFHGLTAVPTTPPCVRGVINLRGTIVAVLDLGVKLIGERTALSPVTEVLIVEAEFDAEPAVVGLLVDTVSRIVELDTSAVGPPTMFGTTIRLDYLRGIGRLEEGFLLILDLDRLLSVEEVLAVGDTKALESVVPLDGLITERVPY